MINELFSIGPLSISPFGVMLVAAFVAAWAQLQWGLRRLGVGDAEDASALVLAGGIGGILGAKIYYAILYRDWSLLFQRFGLVWYGGFVVGALAVIWVAYRRGLPGWRVADAAAPGLALGYGIGRVGCFLVGDDFGMPTNLPWGVVFPKGLPGPTTAGLMRQEYGAQIPWEIPDHELVAVHPTQLYETLAGIMIWAVGVRLIRRGAPAGITTLTVLALLALERFLVEFWRAKDDRLLGVFTVAQLISVAVLVLIMALFLARGRSAARAERDRAQDAG
jgi:phosphatidylglycerol:prolipoprotein diacylglycerol transferase